MNLKKSLPASLLLAITLAANASAYQVETVAEQLELPWSIAFLPNGDRLVTERSGNLRRILADNTVTPPISGVPDVYFAGQGGLFDVILDPEFASNGRLYLSFAAGDAEANATTVVRARLDGAALADVEVIFEAAPKKYAPLHYGGRLAWAEDGALLLTTGDGFDYREAAQKQDNHFGKTIRIMADGSATVWTYGHRNPQGLAVSRDGTVFLNEHGPKGGDEVNVLQPNVNYGWPAITYGKDYNGALVSPFTELPDMAQPVHVWTPSIAPSGLMIYEGALFPEWRGDLFVGALVDGEVRRLDMNGAEVTKEEAVFPEISARVRDIREAPDGSIYVLTDEGAVHRISR